MNPTIEQLRESIDAVDRKILDLLSERLDYVLQVGEIKKRQEIAVYDPSREAGMLEVLTDTADPKLSREAVRRIFSLIIRECRNLEQDSIAPSRAANNSHED